MARSQSARRYTGSEFISIMWVGSTSSSSQLDASASSRFTSVGSRVTPCHSCPGLLLDAYAARSCHCLSRCSNRLLHCGFPSNVTSGIGCPSSCVRTFCIVQASASHQVMLPRSGMRTSLAEKTPRVHLCNSEWVKLQSASSDCTVHGNRVLPLRSEAELTADCWINCRVLGQPQSAGKSCQDVR